jgi:sugar lactone lactonase YvrE
MRELPLEQLVFSGTGLNRPESVLATRDGAIWASHWAGGGVSRIDADGSVRHLLPKNPVSGVHPNGIALASDGSFLLASLGETGGIWQLTGQGELAPWLTEVEGQALPPSNFISLDSKGRAWIAVSTRHHPRALAYRSDIADGFLVMAEQGAARIVADGLGYTNECLVSPCGDWLYVNETFGRRLSRFPLMANGDLGQRQTVAEFGPGIFPDGLAFDETDHIWVVSIVSNSVLRISPDNRVETIFSDAEPEFLDWVEAAFQDGSMGRPHLDNVKSQVLGNISSIAFAGPDRRQAVFGCLLDHRLPSMDIGVTGLKPVHWDWPLPEIVE